MVAFLGGRGKPDVDAEAGFGVVADEDFYEVD